MKKQQYGRAVKRILIGLLLAGSLACMQADTASAGLFNDFVKETKDNFSTASQNLKDLRKGIGSTIDTTKKVVKTTAEKVSETAEEKVKKVIDKVVEETGDWVKEREDEYSYTMKIVSTGVTYVVDKTTNEIIRPYVDIDSNLEKAITEGAEWSFDAMETAADWTEDKAESAADWTKETAAAQYETADESLSDTWMGDTYYYMRGDIDEGEFFERMGDRAYEAHIEPYVEACKETYELGDKLAHGEEVTLSDVTELAGAYVNAARTAQSQFSMASTLVTGGVGGLALDYATGVVQDYANQQVDALVCEQLDKADPRLKYAYLAGRATQDIKQAGKDEDTLELAFLGVEQTLAMMEMAQEAQQEAETLDRASSQNGQNGAPTHLSSSSQVVSPFYVAHETQGKALREQVNLEAIREQLKQQVEDAKKKAEEMVARKNAEMMIINMTLWTDLDKNNPEDREEFSRRVAYYERTNTLPNEMIADWRKEKLEEAKKAREQKKRQEIAALRKRIEAFLTQEGWHEPPTLNELERLTRDYIIQMGELIGSEAEAETASQLSEEVGAFQALLQQKITESTQLKEKLVKRYSGHRYWNEAGSDTAYRISRSVKSAEFQLGRLEKMTARVDAFDNARVAFSKLDEIDELTRQETEYTRQMQELMAQDEIDLDAVRALDEQMRVVQQERIVLEEEVAEIKSELSATSRELADGTSTSGVLAISRDYMAIEKRQSQAREQQRQNLRTTVVFDDLTDVTREFQEVEDLLARNAERTARIQEMLGQADADPEELTALQDQQYTAHNELSRKLWKMDRNLDDLKDRADDGRLNPDLVDQLAGLLQDNRDRQQEKWQDFTIVLTDWRNSERETQMRRGAERLQELSAKSEEYAARIDNMIEQGDYDPEELAVLKEQMDAVRDDTDALLQEMTMTLSRLKAEETRGRVNGERVDELAALVQDALQQRYGIAQQIDNTFADLMEFERDSQGDAGGATIRQLFDDLNAGTTGTSMPIAGGTNNPIIPIGTVTGSQADSRPKQRYVPVIVQSAQ